MYKVNENQYLPDGFGKPAKTYFYVVDEKNRTIHKETRKPYRGKQMLNYKFDFRTHAEEFAAELNGVKMIPKAEMKPGVYYKGYCRNANMAKWDERKNKFVYIRYKFDYYMDTIEHFEDVKETRADGFIPIEEVKEIDFGAVRKVKNEVGY